MNGSPFEEYAGWVDNLTPREKDKVILFFMGQMQVHSLNADGTRTYRMHNDWPITHAKGRSIGEAIGVAVTEWERHGGVDVAADPP
jgi:hypothetical protein